MDLRTQLQQHLGDAFTLERELGGGGMSRVFVAHEVRLSRKVVIKVLSPELVQGLNAERFEREILLAASLQQANIVPVLAAGEVEGLPYFTMPFVEGESLRTRLGGSGLPIADVLAILRDVAKALAYAHSRGIVHRDIKPDNVLLSGGTAVVTDFGIAKALSASRNETGATLTSVGTSIGTPAYMAPEQIAGDPNIDHRVDLYALGCMAYELLSGKSPFADRTPPKMLAAHLSEKPAAIGSFRGDSPGALNSLVMRLLEKDPVDRIQSASDVLRSLDGMSTSSTPTLSLSAPGMFPKVLGLYLVAIAVVALLAKAAVVGIGLPDWVFPGAIVVMLLGLPALLVTAYVKRVARHAVTATPTLTPGGTMVPRAMSGTMATMALRANPHMSWRRTARGGAYAMGAFVVLVAAFMTMRAFGVGPFGSLLASGSLKADSRVVLADITSAPEDSSLAQIVGEAVRAALSQATSIRVIDKVAIGNLLVQMQRDPETPLDAAVAKEVAARAGAGAILNGKLARAGTGYAISLELVSAEGGASLASYQATADGNKDLLTAVDGLAKKLRGKIGESLKQVQHAVPLEQATTANLDALRKYSEGVKINDGTGDPDGAVRVLREAVALDSTFALAWRKLAVALFNAGASAAAQDSALERALKYSEKVPDREKFLIQANYYENHSKDARRDKAIDAYSHAYALDTTNIAAQNQLMLGYSSMRQYDSAMKYARRELATEATVPNAMRVAEILAKTGQLDAADKFRDSVLRADPAAATSTLFLRNRFMVAAARGNQDSVMLAIQDFMKVKSVPIQNSIRGAIVNFSLMSGKLNKAIAVDSERTAVAVSRGSAAPIYGISQAGLDIWMRGRVAEGVKRLDAIAASKAWAAADVTQRPYQIMARLYASAGEPAKARAMMARFKAEDPGEANAAYNIQPNTEIEGDMALAEGKAADAITLFRKADLQEDGLPAECDACTFFNIGRAFDKAGQADSVRIYFEKYLAVPRVQDRRLAIEGRARAVIEKRLGEIYDSRNERQKAIEHYAAFVDQWKEADADLQPVVATVKKRLTELRGQEGK
ncbi:MAG: protein kinase [Gemmatimonadota bacterium]